MICRDMRVTKGRRFGTWTQRGKKSIRLLAEGSKLTILIKPHMMVLDAEYSWTGSSKTTLLFGFGG